MCRIPEECYSEIRKRHKRLLLASKMKPKPYPSLLISRAGYFQSVQSGASTAGKHSATWGAKQLENSVPLGPRERSILADPLRTTDETNQKARSLSRAPIAGVLSAGCWGYLKVRAGASAALLRVVVCNLQQSWLAIWNSTTAPRCPPWAWAPGR